MNYKIRDVAMLLMEGGTTVTVPLISSYIVLLLHFNQMSGWLSEHTLSCLNFILSNQAHTKRIIYHQSGSLKEAFVLFVAIIL